MGLFSRRTKQRARTWLVSRFPRQYWDYRRWRRGDEEPELRVLAVLCPGPQRGTVVDIGANFGMWTSRLVELAGQCVAFEPIPDFVEMLRRGFGSLVTIHGVALSDRCGVVELRVPDLYTGYATVEKANELATRQDDAIVTIEVHQSTLDSYALADVGFIKIDVEGHEEAVLRGCRQTIERCSPNIVVEVEDRHNAGAVDRVLRLVWDLGYATFAIVEGALVGIPEFDLAEHQWTVPPESYARNVICIPEKEVDRLRTALREALRKG